jgi:hypothetical protein
VHGRGKINETLWTYIKIDKYICVRGSVI